MNRDVDLLLKVLERRNYDYNVFKSAVNNLNDEDRSINFFIGVKDRTEYLETTIRYIRHALEDCKYKVSIIVVENDEKPNHYKFGDEYIFVPFEHSKSERQYSRALVYNVGFKLAKRAKWNIFHDVDLLVAHDFFEKLDQHLIDMPKWIQPYRDKRVLHLYKAISDSIMKEKKCRNLSLIKAFQVPNSGAPGGSIVVRDDIFEEVGGYDPEFFYGYAPEDSMFWTKLECLCRPIDKIDRCHQGNAVYMNDNELFHLEHPTTENSNPRHKEMMNIHNLFWMLSYEEKLDYIKKKRELYSI